MARRGFGRGELDRAEHLARDITDPGDRARAMTSLVAALAEAGERNRARALAELAISTARDITDPGDRA